MATLSQSAAQESLINLEVSFLNFPDTEQEEITIIRNMLRQLICKYNSSAELAILCASFEIAIKEKQ